LLQYLTTPTNIDQYYCLDHTIISYLHLSLTRCNNGAAYTIAESYICFSCHFTALTITFYVTYNYDVYVVCVILKQSSNCKLWWYL